MESKKIYTGPIELLKEGDIINYGVFGFHQVENILEWGNRYVLLLRNIATQVQVTQTVGTDQIFE